MAGGTPSNNEGEPSGESSMSAAPLLRQYR
jgi:hypothetical protein